MVQVKVFKICSAPTMKNTPPSRLLPTKFLFPPLNNNFHVITQ